MSILEKIETQLKKKNKYKKFIKNLFLQIHGILWDVNTKINLNIIFNFIN